MELDSASAARPPGERSDEKPAGKKAEKEDSKRPEVTNVLFDPESPISSWEANDEDDDGNDPDAWFMDEDDTHEDDEQSPEGNVKEELIEVKREKQAEEIIEVKKSESSPSNRNRRSKTTMISLSNIR